MRWKNVSCINGYKMSNYLSIFRLHIASKSNRCFENVGQFRYLGTTITNRKLIQEEIKRRLNSGNVRYHSVQTILSSRLLSKNIKIRIYIPRLYCTTNSVSLLSHFMFCVCLFPVCVSYTEALNLNFELILMNIEV
jgi:hypothetical protein